VNIFDFLLIGLFKYTKAAQCKNLVRVGGNGVLFFATGKKIKKNYKSFPILPANPTCVFSL
jgi:hypothetical protein